MTLIDSASIAETPQRHRIVLITVRDGFSCRSQRRNIISFAQVVK